MPSDLKGRPLCGVSMRSFPDVHFSLASGRHWQEIKRRKKTEVGIFIFSSLLGHMWIVASPSSRDHRPLQRSSPRIPGCSLLTPVTLSPFLIPSGLRVLIAPYCCQSCAGAPSLAGFPDSVHAFRNCLFISPFKCAVLILPEKMGLYWTISVDLYLSKVL